MRKKIIAGNWKMNKTKPEAVGLVCELIEKLAHKTYSCEVVVCPPTINLQAVSECIKGTDIRLGSQNIHWADKGAYTGEVSADMLKELGVSYAIIGHSERRQYFGETDKTVNMRAKQAVLHGITPIICVGEQSSERENGETNAVVSKQTRLAFSEFTADEVKKCVVAYEPIWAIGTGKTATSQQANDTIAVIRNTIADLFGNDTANSIRILYGGSMNENNAEELLSMPEIDGGLIGGASLVADKFEKIIK